jgi:preprotein translocase subunit YajC
MGGGGFLLFLALLLVVMYVLMIRPQRQRQQAMQQTIESAGEGDDVLTTGGIYGTIVQAEGDDLVVEIADNLSVHMTRRAIAAVLPPEDEEEADEDADTLRKRAVEEAEVELDEAVVTTREEAVTQEAASETASSERR